MFVRILGTALTAATLVISTSACSYKHMKGDAATPAAGATPPANAGTDANGRTVSQLSFADVKTRVLTQKCLTCHDEYNQYATVFRDRETIRNHVFVLRDMPKRGVLTDDERSTLQTWLDAGAPETVVVAPPVTPLPTPPSTLPPPQPIAEPVTGIDPGPPTWAAVQKGFFEKHCTLCHGSDGPEAGLDLSDYAQVRAKASSILNQVIVKQSMPPPSGGDSGVSAASRLLLVNWIAARMPGPEGAAPSPSPAPASR